MKELISIVIATYNRSSQLSNVLDSLIGQESDDSFVFEILVVDNNSRDETRAVSESYANRAQGACHRIRYVFEPAQGKPFALNRGIREAQGKIIAFTDDDVIIDKRWLMSIVQCFREFDCDGVGGRVLPVYPKETPAWVKENPQKAAGTVVIYDYGDLVLKHEAAMEQFIGANYAFRRDIFAQCGVFRTDFKFDGLAVGEDREFVRRLIKEKKVLYYCGRALIWHPVDLKRLRLGHVIRWHMALGRCAAINEYEEGRPLVYCLGIPRYLIKGIIGDFLYMLVNLFHRMAFWNYFRGFFRKLGMIQEYRSLSHPRALSYGETSCLK